MASSSKSQSLPQTQGGSPSLLLRDAARRHAYTSEDEEVEQIGSIRSQKRKAASSNAKKGKNVKGHMAKAGKMRQTRMSDKEAQARTNQYIARFIYQAGVAFNAVRLESFKLMIKAIGNYGPNLKPPSCHELRVLCLKMKMEEERMKKKTTSRTSSSRVWVEEELEDEEVIDYIETQEEEEELDKFSSDESSGDEENTEDRDDDFD